MLVHASPLTRHVLVHASPLTRHVLVHASPLTRHVQLGSLQERRHLHDNRSKTASGAGGVRIHSMTRWPSSSSIDTLSGLPQMVESEDITSRLMLGSWHEEHACGGNLCMVEAG